MSVSFISDLENGKPTVELETLSEIVKNTYFSFSPSLNASPTLPTTL